MGIVDFLPSFIVFWLEMIGALLVYCLPLQKRRWFALRLAACTLCSLVVLYGVMVLGALRYTAVGGTGELEPLWGILYCGMVFFAMLLVGWFGCAITLREAVYCATCAYLTEHIAYCLLGLLGSLTPLDTAPGGPAHFLVHTGVYFAAYFMFSKKMVRGRRYSTSIAASLGLMLSALFVVLVMSVLASSLGFLVIHCVYAVFCCFFVLLSQVRQQGQLQLQKQLGLQKQLWVKRRAQYEMARDNIDLINRKCHDLKHQVAALRHLDAAGREEAIEALQQALGIYDAVYKTGNGILDTLLTEKSLVCGQNGITLNCIVNGGLLDFMDTIDLYTLFGNALDNAIEAVQALPEAERFISLLVYERAGLLFIQAENRYRGEIVLEQGLPATSKEDTGYHGFGLKSVRHIAKSYGGLVTVETSCQVFLLRVTIPQGG